MQTPPLNPYSLSDVLALLETFRRYILLDDSDTQTMLVLLEQLHVYLLAEENLKQRMMDQHAQTIGNYETQLAQLRRLFAN